MALADLIFSEGFGYGMKQRLTLSRGHSYLVPFDKDCFLKILQGPHIKNIKFKRFNTNPNKVCSNPHTFSITFYSIKKKDRMDNG